MAPIKFEENIKEKLEDRRLEPSQDAWDTLANRLDGNTSKRKSGLFFYLGIAASIVGVLLVYTLVVKSSDGVDAIQDVVNTEVKINDNTTPVVNVETNSQIEKTLQDKVESNPVELKENTQPTIEKLRTDYVVSSHTASKAPQENNSQKLIHNTVKATQETSVAATLTDDSKTRLVELPLNKLDFESIKVLEVVAEIKKLESEGNQVTESEIDSLLKQAERDILKQRIYNQTTRTVDADALLQDVEADLDQSFREKVFDNLKSSFNSVKTAVATRNN